MNYARISPIAQSFKPNKQNAKRHYGSHPYFTKRAWNVVQEYIKHYTQPGDVVLDPFGGSGVAAVESLVLRRKAIYCDISEWACFLARQTAIAPISLTSLDRGFARVAQRVKDYILALYSESDSQINAMRYKHWFPRNVRLPKNADVTLVEDLFTKRMLLGLSALLAAIREETDETIQNLMLVAFSATLAKVNKTFLSAQNRKESRGGSSIFSIYRYKVARCPIELNVWEQFDLRMKRLRAAKAETNELIGDFYHEPETARFIKGSATRLADFLGPESVDYVYTDPPYGGHIAYLDLSCMWNAWLGFHVSDEDRGDEVVVGGERRKTEQEYAELLRASLLEISKVLRPERWLSLVFAHWDPTYWHLIVQTCQKAGLEYVNMVAQPVGTVWSMHKKKNPLRVISGEWILNFQKVACIRARKLSKKTDLEEVVREEAEACIVQHAGATTEMLYGALLPRLLEAGLLGDGSKMPRDIRVLLERFFIFVPSLQQWHLRPDAVPNARLPIESRVRYSVASLLHGFGRKSRRVTAPQILEAVSERLGNGVTLSEKMVRGYMKEFAQSSDGVHWQVPANGTQLDLLVGGGVS
jgi:DNA modification methylase